MKVDTNALRRYSDEMRPMISSMLETRDEVHRITVRVSEEHTTEKMRPALKKMCWEIEELAVDLINLCQVLEDVSDAYDAAEEEVTEKTEGEADSRKRFDGFMSIPIRYEILKLVGNQYGIRSMADPT